VYLRDILKFGSHLLENTEYFH